MREKELKMKIEEENRVRYMNDRNHHQAVKEKTIKEIKKFKHQDYKLGKTMTVQNDHYKKEFLSEVQKRNQERKEQLKQEAEARAERLRQIEEQKKRDNQDFYSTRVEEERQRILNHEKKISKMEKLEAELLNRLKNSQQLEKSEYSNLENALKMSNEACEERKKNQMMVRKPRPAEITKMKASQSNQESQEVDRSEG
mmetsp:Transcript_13609/g.15787  ORF Transcript_13609/g.15787 Transcript_13609/m.15787 type:complete len:198 (-) Transcript_13609:10-603(-)